MRKIYVQFYLQMFNLRCFVINWKLIFEHYEKLKFNVWSTPSDTTTEKSNRMIRILIINFNIVLGKGNRFAIFVEVDSLLSSEREDINSKYNIAKGEMDNSMLVILFIIFYFIFPFYFAQWWMIKTLFYCKQLTATNIISNTCILKYCKRYCYCT